MPQPGQKSNPRIILLLVAAIILVLVSYVIGEPVATWLGKTGMDSYDVRINLILIAVGAIVLMFIVMWLASHSAEKFSFLRRHPYATIVLIVALAIIAVSLVPAQTVVSTYGGVLAFEITAIAGSWLAAHWIAGPNSPVYANLRLLFSRYRWILFPAVVVTALMLIGYAIWIPVWESVDAAASFLQASFILWILPLSLTRSLKTEKQNWTLRGVGFTALLYPLFIAFNIFLSGVGSYRCEQLDCGGWLLRSASPASWAQQLDAANEKARQIDPQAKLVGVQAQPTENQPPNTNYPVLEVDFTYVKLNGQDFTVTIQDNAITWKRDISKYTRALTETIDPNSLPAFVKISPTEAHNITSADGTAFRVDPKKPYDTSIDLLGQNDIGGKVNLPKNIPAFWVVFYTGPDYKKRLAIYIDANTGAVIKKDTVSY